MAAVASAFLAIGKGFAATKLGTFLTTNIFGRLLTSVALSALKAAFTKKPKSRQAGIRTQQTQTGGITPASFVLGGYATEGQLVAPPMSHGQEGKTPNAYLNYVIELGDIPGQQFLGLVLDGEEALVGGPDHPDYGTPITGRFSEHAWIKYYDGSQTAADPMLLDKYGEDPDRPWQADMIGTGLCYAILTFRFNREIFSGFPKVRFRMLGIPHYDPRKDSSVGGSGDHRWADRSTWEPSENFAVQAYNILRGIDLGGGHIWGGQADAEDLPLSTWWAEMNKCDFGVARAEGGTEPAWRSSFEVFVDDEPASVLEDMARGCSARFVENGGIWKVRVGGPGLPLYFFTDDDVIITEPEENQPYSEARQAFNAVQAVYPEPQALWEPKDAPALFNAAFEAQDGGQRRVADLTLTATPYANQVQRVMRAYANDERRYRQHVLNLPNDASSLEPLDVASWSSAANGYDSKSWDIDSMVDPLTSGTPQFRLREVDPSDYDWNPSFELPTSFANVNRSPLPPQAVSGFAFDAIVGFASDGQPGAPGLKFSFDGDGQDDVRGFMWEIRRAGTEEVILSGSIADVTPGFVNVWEGVFGDLGYEGRGRWIVDRPTEWTDWLFASTDSVGIGTDNFWNRLDRDDQAAFDRYQAARDRITEELAANDIDDLASRIIERARVDGEVEEQRVELQSGIDGLSATLTQEYRTATAQDAAVALLRTELEAEIDGNVASVTQLTSALASTDQTIAAFQTQVQAEFDAQSAHLTQNYYTKASADAAIAAAVTEVETELNGFSTTVEAVQGSIDGITGIYSVEINNNGAISGFGLVSDLVDGNPVSDFIVDVDNFRVGRSQLDGGFQSVFTISNGVVYLRNARIRDAAIDTLKIAGNSVIVPASNTRVDQITGNDAWQVVQSETITLSVLSNILVVWSGLHSYSGVDLAIGYDHQLRMKVNGQVVQARGGIAVQDYPKLMHTVPNRSGVITIDIEWKAGPLLTLRNRTQSLFGVQR